MTRTRTLLASACAVALTLSACGGDGDGGPILSVPQQAAGSYTVLAQGDALGFGEAFYNANGSSFVMLATDDRQAATVVYQTANGVTRRVPSASADVTLTYTTRSTGGFTTVTPASAAGAYTLRVGTEPARFTLEASGKLVAGGSACAVSGQINPTVTYGEAVEVQLNFSGCSGASGSFSGVAFGRTDNGAHVVRLVVHNPHQVLDLLAFKS